MPVIFAARSASLTKWAADVGLGKHVFRVGIAHDKAAAAAETATGWAGETDWRIVASQEIDGPSEPDAIARLARREKLVDPAYYPRLKGAEGVFRVALPNVQNAMLVAQAMRSLNEPLAVPKPKAKDIAEYLIRNALPQPHDGPAPSQGDDTP